MIYLIDEKIERQQSYGWSKERFGIYKSNMMRIVDYEELQNISSQVILGEGNVVFLHDSFFKNLKIAEKDAEKFKNKIKESKRISSYVFFGGSYDSIYLYDGNLEIKDDIFYSHLDSYLKSENKKVDILAFGDNFEQEEFCRLNNDIWTYIFLFEDKYLLGEEEKFDILKIANYNERIEAILEDKISVLYLKTELNRWPI